MGGRDNSRQSTESWAAAESPGLFFVESFASLEHHNKVKVEISMAATSSKSPSLKSPSRPVGSESDTI